MSEHNIIVEGGTSVLLETAGYYCVKDILIIAKKGGIDLPKLNNPALAEQIVDGYEAINSEGAVVVGMNPYEMIATNETIAEQSDLIEQIAAVLRSKSAGDASVEDGILTNALTEYSNDRITSLRAYALYGCSKLLSVDFPNVKSVGTYALYNCTGLTTINLPSATSLADSSVRGCSKLTELNCPKVTSISASAIRQCSALTAVNMPELKSAGNYGFYQCTKLARADFAVLTSIGTSCFQGCSVLETLIIRSATMCTLGNVAALSSTKIAGGTGYIYVPTALVDTYRNLTNWSSYESQIRAIEDYPEICGVMYE